MPSTAGSPPAALRATGNAVKTGLTGRVTDLTPAELGIIEAVMGGRWSATMSEIWSRDELDAAGASEADWALEKEIAYWAISRGYNGDELALAVERIMRAGPYRSKWDEARGAVSWLAQDVANAIATTQERLKKYRGRADSRHGRGDPPGRRAGDDETLEQKVIRLERENRQLRATNAVQMTVINGERAEKEALRAKLAEIHALMAVPSKRLSASAKCLAIVLDNTVERTTAYRADPENAAFVQVRYADLAAKTGGSDSTVTRDMKTLSTSVEHPSVNEAAPIWKSTRFVQRMIDGEMRPTSETVIAPKAEGSILAAAVAFEPEEERKHGGKRVAGCPKHPTADLIIRSTTHCAECGDQLGESTQTLRRQDDRLGADPRAPVYVGLSGQQDDSLGGHDGAEQSERASNVIPMPGRTVRIPGLLASDEVSQEAQRRDLDITGRCSECEQNTVKRRRAGVWTCAKCSAVLSVEPWAQKAATVPQERPDRCPAPGCRAMGFRELPDGSWRCLRSNHDPSAYEQLIPSSEWQEIPDGYPCPPGGEFRMDFQTGKNWARWRGPDEAVDGRVGMRLRSWSEFVHEAGCPECTTRWQWELHRERMRELVYAVPTDEEIDSWLIPDDWSGDEE